MNGYELQMAQLKQSEYRNEVYNDALAEEALEGANKKKSFMVKFFGWLAVRRRPVLATTEKSVSLN